MPTTPLKNTAYRLMLPFLAPGPEKHPAHTVQGHVIHHEKQLLQLIRRHHVLGAALLLWDGQDMAEIYTDAANPPHHADRRTYFRVASITKTATAAVMLRMMDAGLLHPDQPSSSFFPGETFPAPFRSITLRHLLSHTSGLTDPPSLEKDLEEGVPLDAVLKQMPVREAPGAAFRYSNLGFGILGCIMEKVTGAPVDALFDEWLFRPLNMRATLSGCRLNPSEIMPVTRVLPYHPGQDLILTPLGKRPLNEADPMRHYGHTAGSMYTDLPSLYRLFRELILNEGKWWKPESLAEMRKEHASYGRLSPTLSYGWGLLRIRDPEISDSLVLGHQGFAYGCADGAFWEEGSGRMMIFLNGGCSEARRGRLGLANRDLLRFAFRKELPSWS